MSYVWRRLPKCTAILAVVPGPQVPQKFYQLSLAFLSSAWRLWQTSFSHVRIVTRTQEWEKLRQEGAIARATLLHNLQVHEDAEVNSVLSSLSQVDVDDAPLFEKLKEANLVMQGDDPVKVVEIAKDTDMQGSPS